MTEEYTPGELVPIQESAVNINPLIQRFLIDPRGGLPVDLEEALFGYSADEMGLHPDEIDPDQIQHQLLMAFFRSLTRNVGEGRMEENLPSIRFLMNDVGDRMTALLARMEQARKTKAKKLAEDRSKRSIFSRARWSSEEERAQEEAAMKIDDIQRGIVKARADLRKALREVIMLDENLDEHLRLKNCLDKIKSLLQFDPKYLDQSDETNRRKRYVKEINDQLDLLRRIWETSENESLRGRINDFLESYKEPQEGYYRQHHAYLHQLVNRAIEIEGRAMKRYEQARFREILSPVEASVES